MKVSEQVENLLKYVPATRSSDKELFITYMQKFGMNLSPEQIAKFKEMPSLESVRRSRQLLQEQGKYPASEEMNEQRYQKFQEARNDPTTITETTTADFFLGTKTEPIVAGRKVLDWRTDS